MSVCFADSGYENVKVHRKITAALLSTGDELIAIGENLSPGKIRNSSIYAIHAYLEQWNVNTRVLGIEKDNAQRIADRMLEGLADSDMLITTGECLSATMIWSGRRSHGSGATFYSGK